MQPAFQYGNTFNLADSPLSRFVYARMLRQEWDTAEDMFFSAHGWVGRAGKDSMIDEPIHLTTEPRDVRGHEFQIACNWFVTGEPEVGANAVARDDAQAVPQLTFTFKTTVLYGIKLDIPHPHTDMQFAISTTGTYLKQQAQHWASIVGELLTIYFCGMRGQSDTYYAFEKQTGTQANIVTGSMSTMSEALRLLHAVNPITSPQRVHTSWASNFNVNASVSPSSAAAGDVLSFEDFNLICVYLDSRTIKREGVNLRQPNTRLRGQMQGDMTRVVQNRKGWVMAVLPEHLGDLRAGAGESLWGKVQLNASGAVGFRSGYGDGNVGEIFGMNLASYNKLPRYWGGSAGDVPIGRCMIPGSQALTIAVMNHELPARYRTYVNPMMRNLSQLSVPVLSTVQGRNNNRAGYVETRGQLGFSKTTVTRPDNQQKVDMGVMCFDCAYTAVDRDSSGNVLL